jgi:hypothetical protein
MRNRNLAALALSATALAAAGLTAPAAHADTVTTTFDVTAGTLSIASAATTVNLGTSTSNVAGTTVTGQLPLVTVTDARASTAGWTSKVASSDFTSGTKTIAAGKAKVYIPVGSGPTVVEGVVTATTTAVDALTGVTLSGTAADLVSATLATGSNQVTYTPTVQVTIDSTVLAGTYSGTITHSVV